MAIFIDGVKVDSSHVYAETMALTADISPSTITADVNNYNPTGLSTAVVLRLASDASRNITGLSGGRDGRVIIFHNVGSNNIVIVDESSSSTAANRFALSGNITLSADQSAKFQYDSTSSRWRAIANPSTATGDLLSTNNLSDVASAATSRTNLGLGSIATQASSSVSISGGSITGITDLAVADGGTGASTTAGAATNLGLGTGDSPQFTAVNIGNASDTTLSRSSAGVLAVEGVVVPTISSTHTLTNKRIDPRTTTTPTGTSVPSINTDTTDIYTITAQAEAITSMSTNLSGTPVNGQTLVIRIKDNGTARAITWGSSFTAVGITLPTTTTANKLTYVGFMYNSTSAKWDALATVTEA